MDIPLRFKILDKQINLENKAIVVKKIDDHNKSKFSLGGENSKFNNWLTGLLKIPFEEYKYLPITKDNTKQEICDYLAESKKILDSAVFGHNTTKNQIIQLITQWITNPESSGNVIGIQGPMGNGKTTLVKDGISKAVDRPFAFVTLGGCSDSSFLEGHNYTYEGSMWGRIVDILIQSQCMNPIIYFDELDKVSQTKRGDEIINMLIHLTDSSQNTQFQDKYFSGIDIDISKSIFIFSFNDPAKISPILLDRLLVIKTDGFEKQDKVTISQDYLIPNLFKQIGIESDKIIFSDEVLTHIIEKYTDEDGVRTLKKCIELVISKLNVLILTEGSDIFKYDINTSELPIKLTNDNIDTLLKEFYEKDADKERIEFAMYC
jgi:ATP-dependent Lon protease